MLFGFRTHQIPVGFRDGLPEAASNTIAGMATGVTRPLNSLDTSLKSEKDLGSPWAGTVSTIICKILSGTFAPVMTGFCTTGSGAESIAASCCGNFRRYGNC